MTCSSLGYVLVTTLVQSLSPWYSPLASLGQVHIPLPGGLGHWIDQFTNSYGMGAGLREVENQFL